MQKIANVITGRTILPAIGGGIVTFNDTAQVIFANATKELTATDFQTWKTANPTFTPITVNQIIGADAVPKLLVEYTTLTTTTEPVNSLVSQTIINGADAPTLAANLQIWKVANPFQKIVRVTQITGLNGGVGILVEYGISTAINTLVNGSISQVLFPDAGGVNTSYAQYVTWKAANPNQKPVRVTYVIADDGTVGILVEYTGLGTTPSVGQIQLKYVPNDNTNGIAGLAGNIQNIKTLAPAGQIFRITPIFQGILVESTLNGITPVNNLVSQSVYTATPDVAGATDAYQVFKTANPTLKPIRLTSMIWGTDGLNYLLAEYIS